jgi:chaperonin cofactor prefoldin
MALPDGNGESYFLVRNKRLSGMFVCVDAQHKASILSGADMYQRFKPEKEATAGPLPSDWKERKGIAEKVVNQALTRMDIHFRKSEKATQAKAIITRMKDQLNLSEESLQILADAFQYVNKGNYDIITKMIAIGKELDGAEKALFALQQTDIDTILQKQIGQIVSHVQERYGKAEVYMALSK